jgi:hypothetical protein
MPAHLKRVHVAALLGCIALAIVSCSAKAASPAPKAEAAGQMSPEETAMHQAAMAQAAVEEKAAKEPARKYEPTLTYLSDKDEEPHVDAEQVPANQQFDDALPVGFTKSEMLCSNTCQTTSDGASFSAWTREMLP